MKWVSVKDKLPEKHGFYKVLLKTFESYEDYKNKNYTISEEILEYKGQVGEVIYWKELECSS